MFGTRMGKLSRALQDKYGTDVDQAYKDNKFAAKWVFEWLMVPDAPGSVPLSGDVNDAGREVWQQLYDKYCLDK